MMKQFNHQKLIACFLIVVLSIALLAVPASAAATTDVEYKVTYNQTAARTLLSSINAYRASDSAWYMKEDSNERVEPTGLAPLAYDYDMEAWAMTRAAELVLCNSGTRPNGDTFASVGTGIKYETRARGASSAEAACSIWVGGEDGTYATQADRRAILSDVYTRMGAACVTVGSDTYWVVLYATGTAGGTDSLFNGDKTVTVPIENSKVTGITSYAANPDNIKVKVASITHETVPTEVTATITTATGGATVTVKNPTWESSNTDFLKIISGELYGYKERNTSIETNLFGAYKVTATVNITCEHYHDATGTQVTKQPTCSTPGKQTFTCVFCGEKQIDYPIETLPHTSKHYALTDATCTEDGYKEHWRCTVCGGYFSDSTCTTATTKADVTLTKLGHVETVNPAVTVSCTVDGKTEGTYCSRCNEELVKQEITPALGHNWQKDEGKAATCTTEGLTEGKHCIRPGCGETVAQEKIPKINHKNKVSHSAKEATCTEKGNIEYWYCPDCGKYFSDEACSTEITKDATVIAALGHQVVDDSVAATCSKSGISGASHCARCEVVLSTGKPVPATGHDIVVLPAVDATCTSTGKTEGAKCSKCSYLVAQKIIPMLDHDYKKVAAKEPTCTTDGYSEHMACSVCGAFYGKTTFIASGHTYETIPAKAATCSEEGYSSYQKCKVCGDESGKTVVPKTAHTEVPITENIDTDGWRDPILGNGTSKKCSVCGEITTIGDTYWEYKMEWAAEPTVSGTTVKLKWKSASTMGYCKGYSIYSYKTADHSDTPVLVKKITSAKTTSCSVTQTPGTTLYYTIRVRDGAGVDHYMYADLKKVSTALSAPSITMKKTDGCTITVSWKAVKGAASYRVYFKDETGGITFTPVDTSDLKAAFTVNPKGTYSAYVIAKSADSIVSSASATKKLTLSYSNPTMTLKALSMSEIKISWKAVSGATNYELYSSTSKDGTFTKIYEGDATEYTYKAAPGNTYYFKIRTSSDKGGRTSTLDFSGVRYIKLSMSTPSITLKQTGNKEVTISWSKLNGATTYQLYRSNSSRGTYTMIADTADTSFVDTDVSLKETWYYKLRVVCVANSSVGYSNYSAVKSIKLSEVEHEMDSTIKEFPATEYADGFALCKCSLCGKQVMMWTTPASVNSWNKLDKTNRALKANAEIDNILIGLKISEVTGTNPELKKAKLIHDWFIINVNPLADEYCTSTYYAYNFGNEAFGAIFRGEASSSGTCKAAAMMFEAAGIKVEHVNKDRYVHQYLRVQCDGVWYIFDTNAPSFKKAGHTGSFFNETTGIVPVLFRN